MKNPINTLPTTRREFFKLAGGGIGLLAFSRFAPSFLVQSTLAAVPAPERDRGILVIVQLAGGNDGLNTLIPFEDAQYYRLRPTLAIDKKNVLRLSGTLGLHPGCAELGALFQEGKLGIVQNVGYPNPNRSHFRSSEIWESASDSDRFVSTGWIGRFLDNTCSGAPGAPANTAAGADPLAVHLSGEVPQSFLAGRAHSTFGLNPDLLRRRGNKDNLKFLETLVNESTGADPGGQDNNSFLKQTMMDALVTEKRVQKVLTDYKPGVAYPGGAFAQSLRNIAGLIAAGLSTRVYFVSLGGFDTHHNQAAPHQNLMRALSQGLSAFQKDLEAHGLSDQVVTMTFSEFGRRPMENESKGTDHGTAAPLFVMGAKIKGGLHGTPPSLDLKRNQDLAFSTDFRQVYATVLDRWFNCPPDAILGKPYHPLSFL
ncbi:MAG: DUF1501 domain-containing protein [Opitutaceae bacterium]|jgi:uncharacterized protein (DUF1501 family)|nr:DUF1501 domain-containing protein [Opitutaceae bacterium]